VVAPLPKSHPKRGGTWSFADFGKVGWGEFRYLNDINSLLQKINLLVDFQYSERVGSIGTAFKKVWIAHARFGILFEYTVNNFRGFYTR